MKESVRKLREQKEDRYFLILLLPNTIHHEVESVAEFKRSFLRPIRLLPFRWPSKITYTGHLKGLLRIGENDHQKTWVWDAPISSASFNNETRFHLREYQASSSERRTVNWKILSMLQNAFFLNYRLAIQILSSANTRAKYTFKHQRTDIGEPAGGQRTRSLGAPNPKASPSSEGGGFEGKGASHTRGWWVAGLRVARKVMSVVVVLVVVEGVGRAKTKRNDALNQYVEATEICIRTKRTKTTAAPTVFSRRPRLSPSFPSSLSLSLASSCAAVSWRGKAGVWGLQEALDSGW